MMEKWDGSFEVPGQPPAVMPTASAGGDHSRAMPTGTRVPIARSSPRWIGSAMRVSKRMVNKRHFCSTLLLILGLITIFGAGIPFVAALLPGILPLVIMEIVLSPPRIDPAAQTPIVTASDFDKRCAAMKSMIAKNPSKTGELERRIAHALDRCARIVDLSVGSDNMMAINATRAIHATMPVLITAYQRTTRIAEMDERAGAMRRLADAMDILGADAEDARLSMLSTANDRMDTQIRFLRSRSSATDPVIASLAPVN